MHASIEEWLERQVEYTDLSYFQTDSMGRISTFFDLETIYSKEIEKNQNSTQSLIKKSEDKESLLPMDKCCSLSIQNGLMVCIQSKFELLNSTVQPESSPVPSELFFVIQVRIKALKTFKEFGKMYNLKTLHLDIHEIINDGSEALYEDEPVDGGFEAKCGEIHKDFPNN